MYIGTQGRGLTILDRTIGITPSPRVIIEKPIVEDQDAEVRWNPLSFWAEMTPAKILTRHRINDGKWSAWSNDHQLRLHDSKPGDYRLRVQAKGAFGQFDSGGGAVDFTILPPLHLRPVFYLPVGGLAIAVFMLGVVMILRRRKHVNEIKKSEAKFRAVTAMTSSGIFICRDDFSIIFANTGITRLTGYTEEELVGMKFVELLHSHSRDVFLTREKERVTDPSVPQRAEVEILVKESGRRWIDLTWGAMTFQGKPATIATAFDITERKQAEEQLISKQEQLRSLATELSLTEERERRRMATYLHDVIGQALALCKIQVRRLQKSHESVSSEDGLQPVHDLIEQSLKNTRSLTFELSPPTLYELSFEAAIKSMAEQLLGEHGLHVQFTGEGQTDAVSREVRIILYHAVKELLVNIIKHANASCVNLIIQSGNSEISITIEDDGVGIESTGTELSTKTDGGFGLFNIRERLTYLGGDLEIIPIGQRGTRVTLRSPITIAKKNDEGKP